MIIVRSLIYFAFLVLNTILVATIGLIIIGFLPTQKRFIIDGTWSRVNLWGLKNICNLSYRVVGEENIPTQPCIVFSNHQSAWETIALISIIKLPKVWVLKRELLYVPIFGWVMFFFRPIAIDRNAGRKAITQIVEEGTKRLKHGLSIIIFPEGTRVATNESKKFGGGGAILAEKSGYPILPIAHNAGVYWKRRGILKYPGVIEVSIGPLIKTTGKKAGVINQQAQEWIETNKKMISHEKISM